MASEARYHEPLTVIPPYWRSSFISVRSGEQRYLSVVPAVRARVSFRLLNLLIDRLPFSGRFDAIFCRNVLIYFDEPTQQAVIARLAEKLTPQGCLFLGLAEGLPRVPPGLTALGQSIYQNHGQNHRQNHGSNNGSNNGSDNGNPDGPRSSRG